MSDLIKRDEVMEELQRWSIKASIDLFRRIEGLSSADAVEVDRTSEWVAVRREEYEDYLADAHHRAEVDAKYDTWGKRVADDNASQRTQNYLLNLDKLAKAIRKVCEENKELKAKLAESREKAVQGEWVDVENEPYCECSVCGSYIDNLDDDYEFCPNCGAKMKGGAE